MLEVNTCTYAKGWSSLKCDQILESAYFISFTNTKSNTEMLKSQNTEQSMFLSRVHYTVITTGSCCLFLMSVSETQS